MTKPILTEYTVVVYVLELRVTMTVDSAMRIDVVKTSGTCWSPGFDTLSASGDKLVEAL